jgi:hypothetical protein
MTNLCYRCVQGMLKAPMIEFCIELFRDNNRILDGITKEVLMLIVGLLSV